MEIYHTSSLVAKLKNDAQVLCAGMPGFEPRVTESESVVLPVTPHPNILLSETVTRNNENRETILAIPRSILGFFNPRSYG